jgi:large repetitive protein
MKNLMMHLVLFTLLTGCSGIEWLPSAPTITTTSLPAAAVGVAYTQALTASGGNAPLTWAVATGTLPEGLTLSSTGTLSGTPTTAGTSTFTAKVTDSSSLSATQSFSIVTTSITPLTLPSASLNTAYSQALTFNGGTAPVSWTISSGTPPAGFTLDPSTGILSGTPTAAGSSTFTVTATDAKSLSVSQTYTLVTSNIVITPATLPAATTGTPYSQPLSATGGTAPYSWTVTSGTLPVWLSFSSLGTFSGIPTTTGSTTFSVTATDAASSTATIAYTLTVN